MVGIVAVLETDVIVVDSEEAMVGDSDSVSILPQILDHLLGPSKRFLGVNDPVFASGCAKKLFELGRVCQGLDFSGKDERVVMVFKALEKLRPKHGGEDFDREQVFGLRRHPA